MLGGRGGGRRAYGGAGALDEVLCNLENVNSLAVHRVALLRDSHALLASPDLPERHASRLLGLLMSGCTSPDSHERGACARLMLQRMITQPYINHGAVLRSLELHIRSAEREVQTDLVKLTTELLAHEEWCLAILEGATLIEYLVLDIARPPHGQIVHATQLSGFAQNKALMLARDTFFTSLFLFASEHGFANDAKGGDGLPFHGASQTLTQALTHSIPEESREMCPLDELRLMILSERFCPELVQVLKAGSTDVDVLESSLKALGGICHGSPVACREVVGNKETCLVLKRCMLDKNTTAEVQQQALRLLGVLFHESDEEGLRCMMDCHRDFGTMLFEMLSLSLSDDATSTLLAVLRVVFVKSPLDHLALALDVGLENLLSLAYSSASAGKTQGLLEWYSSVEALMASSAPLPDVGAVALACAEGLRVSYSAEVLQATYQALSRLALPGVIEQCSVLWDLVGRSIDVVRAMQPCLVTHDGCMHALLLLLRMVLQHGQHVSHLTGHIQELLSLVQSVVLMRIVEVFEDAADSTVRALLELLTVCLDTGSSEGGDWSIQFSRLCAEAGWTGTVTRWMDRIILRAQGQSSMTQACCMAGGIFLQRFLSELGFSNAQAEGFNWLFSRQFSELMVSSESDMLALKDAATASEEVFDVVRVVGVVASILACALFYGDGVKNGELGVCDLLSAKRWVHVVLETGFHCIVHDKELVKNLLTVQTVVVQVTGGEDGRGHLPQVLQMLNIMTAEDVICDPKVSQCLWQLYSDTESQIAAELLALWIDARRNSVMDASMRQNEDLWIRRTVFAKPEGAAFGAFVAMMCPGTSQPRLLSMLELLGQVSPTAASGLVSAGFVSAANKVLMTTSCRATYSATISVLAHLLLSCPSNPFTAAQKQEATNHIRACMQLSKRLSQQLIDGGETCFADTVWCMVALCQSHLGDSEVCTVVSRCSTHLSENEDEALVPVLCSLGLVWSIRMLRMDVTQNGPSNCKEVADALIPALASISQQLMVSGLPAFRAVGVACASCMASWFQDRLPLATLKKISEDALCVCQQAICDHDWPNHVKEHIILCSLGAIINSNGCKPHQVASQTWNRFIAEWGVVQLSTSLALPPKERDGMYRDAHAHFLLPWLRFVALMASSGAWWMSEVASDSFISLLLQSTTHSLHSKQHLLVHLDCWKQLSVCGYVKGAQRDRLKSLVVAAYQDSSVDEMQSGDEAAEEAFAKEMTSVVSWCLGAGIRDGRGVLHPMIFKRLGCMVSSCHTDSGLDDASTASSGMVELMQLLR